MRREENFVFPTIAVLVFTGWLLAICLHEFGHAIVAYWGGDKTVKDKGYLTFNILKYADPQITFVLPIIILMIGGISLPGAAVYIDRRRLRNRLWQSAVAAAGPFMTGLMAVAFALPFTLNLPIANPEIRLSLACLVELQIVSLMFNLLPFPGLDGYGIFEPWLPAPVRQKFAAYGQFGILIICALTWVFPQFSQLLWGSAAIGAAIMNVPFDTLADGFSAFMSQRYYLGAGLLLLLFLTSRHNKQLTPEINYQKARDLFRNNEIDLALEKVNTALQQNSTMSEAWYLRALCLGVQNDNVNALQSFDMVLKLKPDFADGWYNRACCLSLMGDTDAALLSLERAVTLKPELRKDARKQIGFENLQNSARFQLLTTVPVTES
jgi:Zn-dependent protease